MPARDVHFGGRSNVFADAFLGAVAGAVAVWVMDRVDWYDFDHEDPRARRRTQAVRPGGMDPAHVAADRTARALGYELSPAARDSAGLATHYAIGIAPAALYGALYDHLPALSAGRGAAYGLGLFLIEDEIMNPALGLAAGPTEYPWQAHARGLVAHLVYGLVLDAAFRLLRAKT